MKISAPVQEKKAAKKCNGGSPAPSVYSRKAPRRVETSGHTGFHSVWSIRFDLGGPREEMFSGPRLEPSPKVRRAESCLLGPQTSGESLSGGHTPELPGTVFHGA